MTNKATMSKIRAGRYQLQLGSRIIFIQKEFSFDNGTYWELSEPMCSGTIDCRTLRQGEKIARNILGEVQ